MSNSINPTSWAPEIQGCIVDVTEIPEPAAAVDRAASRAVIEQAKGALMISYGIDHTEAFDLLRRHSQSSNIKVRDIAAVIIGNIANPHLTQLPAACRITHILRHLDRPDKLTAPRTPRHVDTSP